MAGAALWRTIFLWDNFIKITGIADGWRPGPWTPEEHGGGGAPRHPGQEEPKYVEDKEAEDKAKSWLQRKCETGF